jgi:hypothetical protein
MQPTATGTPLETVASFYSALSNGTTTAPALEAVARLPLWWSEIWRMISVMGFVVTLISFIILIYSSIRSRQIRHAEHHLYGTITDAEMETQVDHHRFAHVMTLIESGQESDWRQAIIESDIMLDDLLKQLKLPGDTLGDRLKAADRAHFTTLDNAWAAHKVRNQIAHEGSSFKLTNHLAYRTIKQYESVFREFGEI